MFLALTSSLELPIYDHSEVIMRTEYDLQHKANFIRQIFVANYIGSLVENQGLIPALQAADREFDRFANICGADVVQHQWGLTKRLHKSILPAPLDSYKLVARVANIKELIEPEPQEGLQLIYKGLSEYCFIDGPHRYTDAKPCQFIYGTTQGNETPQYWLTDIDLRISARYQSPRI